MEANSLKRSIPTIQPIHHVYKGAVTSDGRFVSISDITEENRHNTTYRCVVCGKKLFPVLPKEKEHHFRHEKNCECDYNRYLHEYAKAELKKRFDEGETFIVQYKADVKCKHLENCQVRNNVSDLRWCSRNTCKLDLKKIYDTCMPEKGFYETTPEGKKRYVADLILKNSNDDKITPTIIEVWVNHECTEKKKNSGAKIIEIKISNENDAQRDIVETDDTSDKPILFYGFNRCRITGHQYKLPHLKIMQKGLIQYFQEEDCSCIDNLKSDPNCIFEMVFHPFFNKQAIQPFSFCKNSYIRRIYGKPYVYCAYNNLKQCPCHGYVFDETKAAAFIDRLKRNGMLICTLSDK